MTLYKEGETYTFFIPISFGASSASWGPRLITLKTGTGQAQPIDGSHVRYYYATNNLRVTVL